MKRLRLGLPRTPREPAEAEPDQGRTEASLHPALAEHAGMLPERSRRTVVILSEGRTGPEVDGVVAAFTGRDRVHLVAEDPPDARLTGIGNIDVVVDIRQDRGAGHWDTFDRHFLGLRRGGVWLLPLRAGEDEGRSGPNRFTELADLVLAGKGAVPADRHALVGAVASVVTGRHAVAVVKRGDHLLKVTDRRTSLLAERNPRLDFSVVDRVEATRLRADIRVVSHDADRPIPDLPTEFDVPALEARRYDGRIAVAGRSLAFVGRTALPESFRYPFAEAPANPALVEDHGDFARLPANRRPKRRLEGAYFHADVAYSGHYGHLLTEVVSRLWAWEAAKAAIPELKLIFRLPNRRSDDAALERTLFGAYGVDPDDIVITRAPVWVDTLVGATPMWHNHAPHWAHPQIQDRVWSPMTDRLGAGREGLGPKIFVSRRPDTKHRPCRNTGEVEAFFADRGFAVVRPENHPLAEQAAIFRDAEVVAGFGGSGMFNVMHCRRLRHLVVLSHESYTARNEQLYACVLGCDVDYFWSPADLEHAEQWSDQAFKSGWAFDFARNSEALSTTLAALG